MKKIIVNTKHSKYPVVIGQNQLSALPILLDRYNLFRNIYVAIDKNVARFHLEKIKIILSDLYPKVCYNVLPSGEKTKSDIVLRKIYNDLLNNNYGRDTTLIAVGGGVTGDIAGYAAATYMRGIHLVQIPTTFLAMIDSSVGGKTGINFSSRKNIIGTFYQPKLVCIDTKLLSTLTKREFNSALGEIVKYGLISDYNFYNYIYGNVTKLFLFDQKIIQTIIAESISIKAGIVSQDEFEVKGIRKILNLGHTFAHAIESNLGFKIKHGEAVAAGILCSLILSNKKGILDNNTFNNLMTLMSKIHLPRIIKETNNQQVYKAMLNDKKNISSEVMFVLLSDIGKVIVDVKADKESIYYCLNEMKKLF